MDGPVRIGCIVVGTNVSEARLKDVYNIEKIKACPGILGIEPEELPKGRRLSVA
jgi:hypothetical protein